MPPAQGNQEDWPIIGPALADPNLKPTAKDIEGTYRHMLEMLVIRKTSKLFRLRSADEIEKAVSFYNVGPAQTPGLIVERIGTPTGSASARRRPWCSMNATPQTQTFSGCGVQAGSRCCCTRCRRSRRIRWCAASKFQKSTGTFTIPARTTAVFIEPCFGLG